MLDKGESEDPEQPPNQWEFKNLSPFADPEGIVRVGG